MSERRLTTATIATFVLGAGMMLAFDSTVTRVLGVALIFAFIVLGVTAIASPSFLERDRDEA